MQTSWRQLEILRKTLNQAPYTEMSCIADLHACGIMSNGDLLVNGCAASLVSIVNDFSA